MQLVHSFSRQAPWVSSGIGSAAASASPTLCHCHTLFLQTILQVDKDWGAEQQRDV